jgi:hypothetical protein
MTHPFFSTPIYVSPSSFSSLQGWYDSSGVSNFVLSTQSRVTTWRDLGFFGRHLSTVALSNQPLLDLSGSGVVFDGNFRFLTFTSLPAILNSDFTIFFVEQRQSASANYILGGTSGTSNQNLHIVYQANTNFRFDFLNNTTDFTIEPYNYRNVGSNESWRIFSFRYGQNTRDAFVNGHRYLFNAGSAGSNLNDLQNWVGAGVGRLTTNFYTGDIRELMIFNGYMSDIDRVRMEGSLAWKWGLNSTLMNFTPVSTLSNLTGI